MRAFFSLFLFLLLMLMMSSAARLAKASVGIAEVVVAPGTKVLGDSESFDAEWNWNAGDATEDGQKSGEHPSCTLKFHPHYGSDGLGASRARSEQ